MKYEKSGLCQLGWLSCVGCCGHHFQGKLEVAKGIEKNTLEFRDHVSRGKDLKVFMNRSKDRRESGICRNAVYDVAKDKVFCPLHPEENSGVDLRKDHHYCDTLHLCKTAFLFEQWDRTTQARFLKFIREKKQNNELDWYSYSMKMADDSLLDEFEGLDWNTK
jgi:hypothetical protein